MLASVRVVKTLARNESDMLGPLSGAPTPGPDVL